MARKTAAQKAPLRAKLRRMAKARPEVKTNSGQTAWKPEKVIERIRVGMLVSRFERQALGELKTGKKAPPGERAMAMMDFLAGKALLERCIPKAERIDHTLSGAVTVVIRDATKPPPGYERKKAISGK